MKNNDGDDDDAVQKSISKVNKLRLTFACRLCVCVFVFLRYVFFVKCLVADVIVVVAAVFLRFAVVRFHNLSYLVTGVIVKLN